MSQISLILFDINGVLYAYDKAARVDYLSRLTGRTPDAVEGGIWASGLEDRGDAGEFSAAAYLRAFGQHLAYPLTVEQWTEALQVSLTPIPSMLDVARRAGRCARLGALTNNNLLVRELMDQLFPDLRPIFGDAICVSSEFRVRKPEPEVYRRCVARLGAVPEHTLFIDDAGANVAGAEQAGLIGHCHTDEAALTRRLEELGVF